VQTAQTSLASSDTGIQATQESEVKIATALVQRREQHKEWVANSKVTNTTQSGRQYSNETAMTWDSANQEGQRESESRNSSSALEVTVDTSVAARNVLTVAIEYRMVEEPRHQHRWQHKSEVWRPSIVVR